MNDNYSCLTGPVYCLFGPQWAMIWAEPPLRPLQTNLPIELCAHMAPDVIVHCILVCCTCTHLYIQCTFTCIGVLVSSHREYTASFGFVCFADARLALVDDNERSSEDTIGETIGSSLLSILSASSLSHVYFHRDCCVVCVVLFSAPLMLYSELRLSLFFFTRW